jgi:hypothetical protein
LSRLQRQLLDGVRLPDFMRRAGGDAGPRRLATGRGQRLFVAGEPALQRTRAGQGVEIGMLLAQLQAQVGRAPGGVLRVQEQRLLNCQRRRRGRAVVARAQGSGAAVAEAHTQSAHSPLGEIQLTGDGRGAQAALLGLPDAPPQRQGKGSGHG